MGRPIDLTLGDSVDDLDEPDVALVPFPRLPPLPEDPGEYLTYFAGFIPKFDVDKDGRFSMTVVVDDVDKYKALPLSDIRGRVFSFAVYAEHGRKPLVEEGVAEVYRSRVKVEAKRTARKIKYKQRKVDDGNL